MSWQADLANKFLNDRMVSNNVRLLHRYAGDYWLWDTVKFTPVTEEYLKCVLLKWLTTTQDKGDPRERDQVWESVKATLTLEAPVRMPQWLMIGQLPENVLAETTHEFIRVQNGILDVTAMAAGDPNPLRPATPRWFTGTIFPTPYIPQAQCPKFLECVEDWMQGDKDLVALLQEFAGYCLVPDTSQGMALFMEGEGSNGKTTFCEVITGIVGPANCSAVPLERWAETFSLNATVGKLINYASETDTNKPLPAARLKAFITGDLFTYRRMYRDEGLTIKPTARLIITWNRRPKVTDESDGFWRRVLLVPWRRQYSIDERDEQLLSKLKQESSGILNWMLEGLARLRRTGKFTRSSIVRNVTESFRAASDPCRTFLRLRVVEQANFNVRKTQLFAEFCDWCEDNGLTPPSSEALARAVLHLYPSVRASRIREGDQRVPVYTNLKWKELPCQA